MTIYVKDLSLTMPLILDEPTKNVVVVGTVYSTADLSFNVNNLIVTGKIIATKNLTVIAVQDLFNPSNNIKVTGKLTLRMRKTIVGCSQETISKIKSLGVKASLEENNLITTIVPEGAICLVMKKEIEKQKADEKKDN